MLCAHCGKEVDEGLNHCPFCGESLFGTEDETQSESFGDAISKNHDLTESVARSEDEAVVLEQESDDAAFKDESFVKKSFLKKRIVIIAAVVAFVVLAAFVIWFAVDQHNREIWEQEHQAYPVEIDFIAEGYEPTNSSPIPLHVEGKDFEGNEVSADYLVGGRDASSFSLMRGSYTVTVSSTPIASDGTIYDVSSSSVQIEVVDPELDSGDVEDQTRDDALPASDSGESKNNEASETSKSDEEQQRSAGDEDSGTDQPVYEIALVPLDPIDVTENQLQAVCDSLVAAGVSEEEAQSYKDAAIAKVEQAKADQRAQKKKEFESRLYALRDAYRTAASAADTQMDMNSTASDYYRKFDALLNDVYGYLAEVLSESEMDVLRVEQAEWVETRESQMWSAQSKSFGGTMASLEYNDKGIDVTQQRITELINMIP